MWTAIVVCSFVVVCNAGFLPFYGQPITSAAAPYVHGFANPVFHQPFLFNNFYTHQPFFKTFLTPQVQPIFYHQPQPHFLPFPTYLTLPSAPAAAQEQKEAGGYGAPSAPAPGGYGAPSAPAPGGYGAPASAPSAPASGGYDAPASAPSSGYGAAPSGPAPGGYERGQGSGPSGQAQVAGTGSDRIEVFEDDFRGADDKPDATKYGDDGEKRDDQFQSFIVNSKSNDAESESLAAANRLGTNAGSEQGYSSPKNSNGDGGR